MMNNKGRGTVTGVIISIILVMALFYGTFNYVSSNYDSANISIPINYSNSYDDLQTAEADLDSNIEEIKSAAQNISEADGNAVSVAWNGLKGLALTIRLFINIIDVGVNTFNAVLPGLSWLPSWTKLLIEMAIVITIVLIIIGAFKGETKT